MKSFIYITFSPLLCSGLLLSCGGVDFYKSPLPDKLSISESEKEAPANPAETQEAIQENTEQTPVSNEFLPAPSEILVHSDPGSMPEPVETPQPAEEVPPELEVPTPVVEGSKLVKVEDGLAGGHFDLDIRGQGNAELIHIHEFDDKYGVNGVSLVGQANFSLDKKTEQVQLSLPEPFRIRLDNAALSTGGYLKINDDFFNYQLLPNPDLVYSLTKSDNPDIVWLKELSVSYAIAAIVENSIRSSEPRCVKDDEPGPDNAIRHGAFTVSILNLAGDVIWQASTYQHNGKCVAGQ